MNIVCIGAHPDDGEVYAGGTLVKWSQAGHRVLLVSMTNGDIGHHEMSGGALANRRRAEARRSAEIGGFTERVLDNHDGELMPSLDVRKSVVRLLREWKADLVLTHRPYDYHPDHRYAAMAVQDAAFMVTVPHFCPDVPALASNPVFLYMMDEFTRPVPFRPDVAVDVGDVMETKWAMIHSMASQFYEWLPWIMRAPELPPADEEGRKAWLKANWDPFFRAVSHRPGAREALAACLGAAGTGVAYAELFELCEYGHCPNLDELRSLFPR
jgi:LmbE family N-acetylglucosaminyl deacetylase